MSAKPPAPPAIWGSDPSANLAEPGASRRGLGWAIGDRPLDGHLNQVLREGSLLQQYVLDGVFTPSIKSPAYLTDTITPLVIGASQFTHQYPPSSAASTLVDGVYWINFTIMMAWVPLTARCRVRKISVRCLRSTGASSGSVELVAFNDANDTGLTVGSVAIPGSGSGAITSIDSAAIDYTIPSSTDTCLALKATAGGGGSNIALYRVVVTWDRPVV